MSTRKYLYWNDEASVNSAGEVLAVGELLVGYTPRTVEAYQKMADELRKTFPHVANSEIMCGHITSSISVFGFSIISFSSYLPKGDYPDWIQIPSTKLRPYLSEVGLDSLPERSIWSRMQRTFSLE